MESKKVAIIAADWEGGGGEKWLRKFVLEFGYIPLLVGKNSGDDSKYIKSYKLRFKYRYLSTLVLLILRLKRLNVDVIFLASGRINIALIGPLRLFFPRKRIIVRETNLPKLYDGRLIQKLYVLLNLSDKIIAQSLDMKENLVDLGVWPDKIKVIYNGIDLTQIRLPFDGIYERLLFIGRFEYQKGVDRLIENSSEIARFCLDSRLKFVLIGTGSYDEELSNCGFNVHPWIKDFSFETFDDSILLFTSRWEGMPNVVLEAALYNIPVIALPWVGGFKELSSLSNIFIIQDLSYESLAEVFAKITSHRKDRSWVRPTDLQFFDELLTMSSVRHLVENS